MPPAAQGWDNEATERLSAAAEETVLSLLDGDADTGRRRLLVIARADGEAAELEFVAAGGGENLEDRMVLGNSIDAPPEQNVSLRLLRHFASEVRHQQYHDADIVTVRVERTRGPARLKASNQKNGATERAECGRVQLPRIRQAIVNL